MNAGLRNAALAAAAVLCPTLACHYEPATPRLAYALNRAAIEANAELAADPGAQTQLAGALEFLFGTPQGPRYLTLPEWAEDGFDPNYWGEDHVRADEAAWERVVASNREAYRRQIEAIRAGEFDAVERPRYADDLWARWQELREELPAGGPDVKYLTTDDGQEVTWRDEAIYRFENYYPSLANTAEFYRQQCYHCHGAEGGGDGVTSRFLEPRPRDYRKGIFKFTPLRGKARPRHEDLFRVLTDGIYTTAMPSFRRFTDAQLHGLVDYVRLLAVRGKTEDNLVAFFAADEGFHFDNVKENYLDEVEKWREAPEKLITYEGEIPRPTPERVEHGRYLFTTPGDKGGANCASCHGVGGRGDGASAFEADPENPGQLRRVRDDWGNPILVRDLTRGVFRFGRRPIDLYRRIYAGINGTPMPEHFGMTIKDPDGTQRPLSEDDVWDLVFFVREITSQPLAVAGQTSGRPEHD